MITTYTVSRQEIAIIAACLALWQAAFVASAFWLSAATPTLFVLLPKTDVPDTGLPIRVIPSFGFSR